MMKTIYKVFLLLLFLAFANHSWGQVITEIMYNTPSTDDEWIEIHNNTGGSIDLENWTIELNGTTEFTFPASSVIADGVYATVALGSNGDGTYNNDNPFTPDFNSLGVSNADVAITNNTNNLSNSSRTITLKNASGTTIDEVTYDDGDASSTDGDGPSYEIIDLATDNSTTASNWQASTNNGGSPGAATPAPTVSIRLASVNPDTETITVKNLGMATTDISNYQLCLGPGNYNIISAYTAITGDLNLDANEEVTIDVSGGGGTGITSLGTQEGLGLFTNGSFSSTDPDVFIDYVQWGAANQDRSGQAVTTGVWDDANNFVSGGTPYLFVGGEDDFGSTFWRVSADFNLQVTEIWFGQDGTDVTNDWFEIRNDGTEAWVSGENLDLYYDDDSEDANAADLIEGLTDIQPGESVIVVIGDNSDATDFTTVWSPVADLTGIEVGFTNGAGLENGVDGVALWIGEPEGSADEFETYPDGSANSGQSYDVDLTAFSTIGNANNAVATLELGGSGDEQAIASPGNQGTVANAVLAISATDANKDEGNSGTTDFTFTVLRSGDISGTTNVDYAVTSSEADTDDFDGSTLPSGTVMFAADETSKIITINVTGDTDNESDETFTVTLSNATGGATINTTTADGTIQDDDTPVVSILPSIVFNEVLADPNSSGSNNFDTDGDGTAETQDEFIEIYNTSNSSIDISGLQFWDAGSDNYFTVPNSTTLGPNGYVVVVADIAGGTLPTVPSGSHAFSADGGLSISNSGDNLVLYDPNNDEYIQAIFNGDAIDNPTMSYTGFSSTATLVGSVLDFGNDTDGVSLALSPDGDTGNPVQHNTIDDGSILATPGNSNIGGALDPEPTNHVTAFTATETSSTAIDVTWTDATGGQEPAGYLLLANTTGTFTDPVDGTAQTDDTDLSDGVAVVNIAQGVGTQSFTGLTPATQYFFKIFPYTNSDSNIDYKIDGTVPTADATTQNGTSLSIAADDADKAEGNSGTTPFTFTVTRSGDVTGTTDVDYAVTSSEADTDDFDGSALPSGTVNFLATETSKTITINVTGDTDVETNESFTVTLSNATNGATITTTTANGTIQDDDVTFADVEINELRISSSGASDDNSNYVEIYGANGASLSGLSLVVLSGEFEPGTINNVFDLGSLTIDEDNFILVRNTDLATEIPQTVAEANDLVESFDFFGSPSTFLIVTNFTGAVNDDLDTNNDGTLDTTPWGSIVSSVSLGDDDGNADFDYSSTAIRNSGSTNTPSGIYRNPDNTGDFEQLEFNNLNRDTPGSTNEIPSIIITETLSDFGSVDNGSESTEQSYTIEGSNLTTDVTVTAPDNFQISKTTSTGFATSLTYTSAELNGMTQTVFVKFVPTSGTNGVKNGDITHMNDGNNLGDVNVSGSETGNAVVISTIQEARDASIDDVITITGIATTPNYGFNNGQFYIQDNTAGINIFIGGAGTNGSGLAIAMGDEVTITGTRAEFNSQAQISANEADVTVNSNGNTLPTAVTLLGTEVTATSNEQGKRVTIEGVTIKAGETWPTDDIDSGSGVSVVVVAPDNNEFIIRIDNDESVFDGSTEPSGSFTLTGVLGRFNDEAQVFPFVETDIVEDPTNPTALEEQLQSGKLNIFPNPSHGFYTMTIEGEAVRKAEVEVYNTMGRLLFTDSVESREGEFSIDITSLPAGKYILKLKVGEEQISRRIVKY